jgi:hypothetical protein
MLAGRNGSCEDSRIRAAPEPPGQPSFGETHMTEVSHAPPKWRLITFWVLMALLLFLHLGERPEQALFLVTAFTQDFASHEIHVFAQGVITWAIIGAILANLRRPVKQVGSAWVYGIISIFGYAMFLLLGDLPAEVVPILAAVLAVGVLAFVAHPSRLRDRLRPVGPASLTMLGMLVLAAIPLLVYGFSHLATYRASGPGDEHWEFGHWIIMAVYAFAVLPIAAIAGLRVSGWRSPAWTAGLMVALLGVASLVLDAPSQLATPWALGAVVWGVAFIVIAESGARKAVKAAEVEGQPVAD